MFLADAVEHLAWQRHLLGRENSATTPRERGREREQRGPRSPRAITGSVMRRSLERACARLRLARTQGLVEALQRRQHGWSATKAHERGMHQDQRGVGVAGPMLGRTVVPPPPDDSVHHRAIQQASSAGPMQRNWCATGRRRPSCPARWRSAWPWRDDEPVFAAAPSGRFEQVRYHFRDQAGIGRQDELSENDQRHEDHHSRKPHCRAGWRAPA